MAEAEVLTDGGTPTRPHPGFFLVLDGPDGGGKTTQAARLADWLRARGFDVVTCRDPGGTALGDRLRGILLERQAIDISMRAEMLLFMASRAQLVDEVIRPALVAGRVVICDRFSLANIVYQGHAGGLGVAEVDRLAHSATGGLQPDLTLILDVEPEQARARVGPARDRMEDRPADYHRRVREGFLEAARAWERWYDRTRSGDRAKLDDPTASASDTWLTGPFASYARSPIQVVHAAADPETVFHLIKREVMLVLALDPRS